MSVESVKASRQEGLKCQVSGITFSLPIGLSAILSICHCDSISIWLVYGNCVEELAFKFTEMKHDYVCNSYYYGGEYDAILVPCTKKRFYAL